MLKEGIGITQTGNTLEMVKLVCGVSSIEQWPIVRMDLLMMTFCALWICEEMRGNWSL